MCKRKRERGGEGCCLRVFPSLFLLSPLPSKKERTLCDLRVVVVELAGAGRGQLLVGDDLQGGQDLVLREREGRERGVREGGDRAAKKKKKIRCPPLSPRTSFFSLFFSGSGLGRSRSGFRMSNFSMMSFSIWSKSGTTCE